MTHHILCQCGEKNFVAPKILNEERGDKIYNRGTCKCKCGREFTVESVV